MNISPVIYQLFGVACLYAWLLLARSQERKYARTEVRSQENRTSG